MLHKCCVFAGEGEKRKIFLDGTFSMFRFLCLTAMTKRGVSGGCGSAPAARSILAASSSPRSTASYNKHEHDRLLSRLGLYVNNQFVNLRHRKVIHFSIICFSAGSSEMLYILINPYSAMLIYLNFRPLEGVSRYRDPQLQVAENYSIFLNFSTNICNIYSL